MSAISYDLHWEPGIGAAAACPSEGHFPCVGLDRQPDFSQPEDRRCQGYAVIIADDEPATLVRGQRVDLDRPAVAERNAHRASRRVTNKDRSLDRRPSRPGCALGD